MWVSCTLCELNLDRETEASHRGPPHYHNTLATTSVAGGSKVYLKEKWKTNNKGEIKHEVNCTLPHASSPNCLPSVTPPDPVRHKENLQASKTKNN